MLPALLLAGLLASCAPAATGPILAGHVDPELVAASIPVGEDSNCALRLRASLPVSVIGVPIVPAEINGQPASMIFDTGAENTLITAAAAKRLRVTSRYDFVRSMAGIGRAVVTGDAALRSMSLGGVKLSFPRALVGEVTLRTGELDADGLLGASVLGDFDLDLDISNRRIGLYDRTECSAARPAWKGRYVTVPTTRSLSLHPFFPMRVNGRTVSATIDTGAQRTVITSKVAAAIGIGGESELVGRTLQARGAAGETMPATMHAVEVSVAGLPLRSPVIVTAAGLPRDIDALLGLDFLLSHRVWLSYGSRRIFIAAE